MNRQRGMIDGLTTDLPSHMASMALFMVMIAIRPARKEDTQSWLRLRCALWPEGPQVEHAGEIGQFFSGQAEEPQAVAYLERWYMAPGARGRGIGRTLVEAAEAWGRRGLHRT